MATRKPSRPKRRPSAKVRPPTRTPAPTADDPAEMARYVITLLEELGRQGTAEGRRLRDAMIQVVSEFRQEPDREKARAELKTKLLGLEVGAAEILVQTTRRLRDRIGQGARRLGTKSAEGKSVQAAVNGLTMMIDGLTKLLDAARVGSEELRREGRELVGKARQLLTGAAKAASA